VSERQVSTNQPTLATFPETITRDTLNVQLYSVDQKKRVYNIIIDIFTVLGHHCCDFVFNAIASSRDVARHGIGGRGGLSPLKQKYIPQNEMKLISPFGPWAYVF